MSGVAGQFRPIRCADKEQGMAHLGIQTGHPLKQESQMTGYFNSKADYIKAAGEDLQHACHKAAASWWIDADGEDVRSYAPKHFKTWQASKLMLCVSELAEGMEGLRKDQMDDHLPHRKMMEVELADCVIRAFDLAGGLGFDLGSAIAEKLEYNSRRLDHKPEHRNAAGGKSI